VPFDAVAQAKAEPREIFVPRPVLGKFGLDQIEPVLRLVLFEQNEIVEDAMNGATEEIVASSWIDALAGLSR